MLKQLLKNNEAKKDEIKKGIPLKKVLKQLVRRGKIVKFGKEYKYVASSVNSTCVSDSIDEEASQPAKKKRKKQVDDSLRKEIDEKIVSSSAIAFYPSTSTTIDKVTNITLLLFYQYVDPAGMMSSSKLHFNLSPIRETNMD